MDALKKLCEKCIEKQKGQENKSTRIVVSKMEDFYSVDSREVESLVVSRLNYDGNIPEMLSWPNLKCFSGTLEQLISIEKKINPKVITELSISLNWSDESLVLEYPNLRKLTLWYRGEDYNSRRVPLDFSIAEAIEELEIRYGYCVDYSCITELPSLKRLLIKDGRMTDIHFLENKYYPIDDIRLYGKIESLEGIESQWATTSLHLEYNAITDISPLKDLKYLEYLNIYGNPITNIEELKHIPKIVFTDTDMALSRVESLISNWDHYVINQWYSYNEGIKNSDSLNYFQKMFASKTMDKQIEYLLQQCFDRDFLSINPDHYSKDFDSSFKPHFVASAKKKYPFLTITDRMREIMRREQEGIIEDYPGQIGRIPFMNTGKDFYIIDACIVDSADKQFSGVTKEIEKKLQKYWYQYANDIEEFVSAEIRISSLYNSRPDEELTLAIIMAIKSAYYHKEMPEKTVFTTVLSNSGRLRKKTGFAKGQTSLMKMLGYEQLCVMAGEKTIKKWNTLPNREIKMIYYNSFEEMEEKVFGF